MIDLITQTLYNLANRLVNENIFRKVGRMLDQPTNVRNLNADQSDASYRWCGEFTERSSAALTMQPITMRRPIDPILVCIKFDTSPGTSSFYCRGEPPSLGGGEGH